MSQQLLCGWLAVKCMVEYDSKLECVVRTPNIFIFSGCTIRVNGGVKKGWKIPMKDVNKVYVIIPIKNIDDESFWYE